MLTCLQVSVLCIHIISIVNLCTTFQGNRKSWSGGSIFSGFCTSRPTNHFEEIQLKD